MNKKLKEKMLKSITSKNAVKQAIINKGVEVGDDFSTYASAIDSIQSGGGGSTGDGKYHIRYLDIDGTILKEEYLNEGDSLTPPKAPNYDSDYLVFDSWNYDVENTVVDRDYDIGAIYNTVDNCTYMFCRFTTNTRLNPTLAISGSPTIDWGDGTVDTNKSHTYADEGEYIIKISGSFSFSTSKSSYLLGSANLSKALTKCYVSNSIKSIGSYAFYYCYSLQNISIPNSVTSIDGNTFNNCYSLQSVSIPNSVTSIENDAFYICQSLQSVSIPNSITSIKSNLFNSCYSLENVNIPNSVISIGGSAFSSCYSLKNINIPNSVTSIGSSAFQNCYSLENVNIPNGVTIIESQLFNYCQSLKNINIPDSVISIGNYAFQNCYSLKNINIPNSVTSIGGSAFYYCYGLTSVSIPSGVTSIGSYAFSSCRTLKRVSIPNSIKSIGSSSFYDCRTLQSVSIPNSVTNIESNAFYYCYSIKNYFILCETVPTLASTSAFNDINKSCIMWVSDSIIESLKTATNWSTYASYMKPLSECPQELLDEHGIERPEPLPEPSGYTVHFEQTGMYGVGGEWSFDGITWFSLDMNDTYAPKTVENVTKVKLKISNNYMSAEWSDDSGNVILSDIGESDFITLTKDTTFSFNHWD